MPVLIFLWQMFCAHCCGNIHIPHALSHSILSTQRHLKQPFAPALHLHFCQCYLFAFSMVASCALEFPLQAFLVAGQASQERLQPLESLAAQALLGLVGHPENQGLP